MYIVWKDGGISHVVPASRMVVDPKYQPGALAAQSRPLDDRTLNHLSAYDSQWREFNRDIARNIESPKARLARMERYEMGHVNYLDQYPTYPKPKKQSREEMLQEMRRLMMEE